MTEEVQTSNIEENLPMVNYIMLHRIYDMLSLIATELAGEDKTARMVEYHDKGFLLGPSPSFTPQE